MKVSIYTGPIFDEVRQKSHLEVQDIKDVEARDNARAGLDKSEEINRCIRSGFAQVERLCLRFLAESFAQETDDAGGLPQYYSYDFEMSLRRASGKSEPLASAMHDFVVQQALAAFYTTVGQAELSARHSAWAQEHARQIEELLYTKQPPRL